MEQRPLRLGDILDDYCPRERRVTNHAIVAMIEEDVRQTRCTTCDAEHAYKGAKVPRRKKKETTGALYKEVLAGMPEVDAPILTPAVHEEPRIAPPPAAESHRTPEPEVVVAAPSAPADDDTPPADEPMPRSGEEGPVHRQLIRATLPRIEGQKEARPVPDFTMRQPIGRSNGRFRQGDPRMRQRGTGSGNGDGNSFRGGGGQRFGSRAGGRTAAGGGFRAGQSRPGGGSGRKRSR